MVELVQVGLFESWLVKAPQRQTYSNGKPRRHLADLVIAVPAGIDEHFAERIQLFHGHRKFFAEQVHQARNARRAPRYHNALDAFAAGRGPEEVKGLLDF